MSLIATRAVWIEGRFKSRLAFAVADDEEAPLISEGVAEGEGDAEGVTDGVADGEDVAEGEGVAVGVTPLSPPTGLVITSPGLSAHFPPSLVPASFKQVIFAP